MRKGRKLPFVRSVEIHPLPRSADGAGGAIAELRLG
jgi:hypothetical protein